MAIEDILNLINTGTGAPTAAPTPQAVSAPKAQETGNQRQAIQDKLNLSVSRRAINTAVNDKFPDSIRVGAINQYVKIWNSRFPGRKIPEVSAHQFSSNRPAFQGAAKKLAAQIEMFSNGELNGEEFARIADSTNSDLVNELQAERPLLVADKKQPAAKPTKSNNQAVSFKPKQAATTNPTSPPALTEDLIKIYTDQGISRERVEKAFATKFGGATNGQ